MMSIAVGVSIIALLFSIFFGTMTLLFTIKNSKRTDTKDLAETIKDSARTNVMLEMISKTTQAIEKKMDAMCEELKSHDSRIIKLETVCDSLKYRLEVLERKTEEMEDEQHER